MEAMMMQFKDLQKIPFEEIRTATNNFHKDTYLGGGGFGNVYKGELSRFKERGMVAFKRLDRQYGQGETEFLKEISTLSQYKHENLIALLGYCKEGEELILVYEYAAHGSLDFHLRSPDLTWTQRLKICLQAAEGLRYLHDPNGAHHKVIHRDIKSGNILLDEKWNAKIADVGLSKISPENANLVTGVTGTPGYIDPEYQETFTLTEHSDVYSFGVMLFEVLCGSSCYEILGENHVRVFLPKWKKSYHENKLEEIIFKELDMKQIDPSSIIFFSKIAYQCLNKSGKERPTMADVVSKLKATIQMQKDYDMILKHPDPLAKKYIEIVRTAVSPVKYRSIEELKECLSEGVLINGGKTWLSLNDKGEHHVMVSIEEYLSLDDPNSDYSDRYSSKEKSRFAVGCYKTRLMEFKLRVTAPLFLSLDVTYGLNLVLHASEIDGMKQQYVGVRYKIQGERKISILHFVDKKEGKQLVAELYQFNSTEESILDLEILLEDFGLSGDFYIEGIEFLPLEKVEHQVVIANREIVRGLVPPLFYRFTEEESKVLLSQGVLLNGGKMWLCINEKGEHIERIYIQSCVDEIKARRLKDPSVVNSRFPGGLCYQYDHGFKACVRGEYLTPHISYTLNLVFRYKYESCVNSNHRLRYKIDGEDETKVFIIYPSTHMREDGWFIVPFYHFTTQHTTADLLFEFENNYPKLLVAGIEFQPSKEKVELPVFEEYQHILEAASQSLIYTSLDELKQILSKGIHLKDYKTWFSLTEKGQHCHMISIKDCLIPNQDSTPQTNKSHYRSRFSSGKQVYADLKYRLRGEATTSVVYLASQRKYDDLYMAELYQFTSDGSIVDLEIDFDDHGSNLQVEGILFQPLEKVEDQLLEDDRVEDIKTISDSDTYWEQNIPNDYEETLKLSKVSLVWKTKKELYSILCKGFLLDNGYQWFSVDKNGKKCQMLSARAAASVEDENNSNWESSNESRFGEVLVITGGYNFRIQGIIEPQGGSPETSYAAYLVFKLPQDQSIFEAPIHVEDKNGNYFSRYSFIYLASPPHTPFIGSKLDENTYNPLNRYKGNAFPQQRSDGCMAVKVWEFQINTESVPMDLYFKHPGEKNLSGLMIQGIELRPI
ncbi:protein kinase-like domain, Phloem protein 2-like protein [Artemisia annua]|uniref:Protein kinase-like domain, Phloem protein 2-like protein n=1 Tax=Artemisia annua TaxID=35608 RepID=A0A2U1LCF7_ARTAN|nr:protein kinase-like domain, Phloem protein 2-like protein [Artemisia annua]